MSKISEGFDNLAHADHRPRTDVINLAGLSPIRENCISTNNIPDIADVSPRF
jgi:hypothetical protein